MQVEFTERREACVVLEVADHDLISNFGPDEVDSVDHQLISFCDELRRAAAAAWLCPVDALRCTVAREHRVAERWQGWRVTVHAVAGRVEDWAVAAPQAARARLQAAQKKRAGSAGPQG